MKKIGIFVIALLLAAFSALSVSAESDNPRLVDGADLLTSQEESEIIAKLDAISTEFEYDVVIVTADTLGGKSAMKFAQSSFVNGGYGMGENDSGVILIVGIKEREWYIEFFGDERVTEGTALSDYFLDDLSGGDYYGAFDSFADAVQGELEFSFGTMLVVCFVGAFIVAFIVVSIMKGKLKSVRFQDNARAYVRDGSFVLANSRDLYLYSTTSRVARPKNTGSGGSRSGGGGGSRGGGGRF